MKTITEFHVATLKTAHKTRQELLTAGKTAEELPAALGEVLKLEGDKLANMIAALEFVEADTKSKSLDLKRVIVQTLTEKETAGAKTSLPALKREDFYFTIEYFPPLPGQEKKQPRGRDDDRGGRGRDGKRGDRKGKGGPRGDRDGARGGDRPRGPGRDAGAPRPEGATGENRRPPRAPRDPNAPQAARPPRDPSQPRPPRAPRPPAPERAPIVPPDASLLNDGKSPFKIVVRSPAELAEAAAKMPPPSNAPVSEKPTASAEASPSETT
jgi:hypothetical protein